MDILLPTFQWPCSKRFSPRLNNQIRPRRFLAETVIGAQIGCAPQVMTGYFFSECVVLVPRSSTFTPVKPGKPAKNSLTQVLDDR
jgi:hypothetical protein